MSKFNLGDIVYHKATLKRCVVSDFSDGKVVVTTEDGEQHKYYSEEELYSENEYNNKNSNNI
jgi:ribosomal protein S17